MCEFNKDELYAHHKRSFDNWRYAHIGKSCGCFSCLRHFDVSEIMEWVDTRDTKTAFCPYCHIDSIIIETENDYVEHELLREMCSEFFYPIKSNEFVEKKSILIDLNKTDQKTFKDLYFKPPYIKTKFSRIMKSVLVKNGMDSLLAEPRPPIVIDLDDDLDASDDEVV